MIKSRKILALLMSAAFLFQPVLSVEAITTDSQSVQVMTTQEQTATTLDGMSVEARFSSNHIRFKQVEGATGYHVLRADAEAGEYTQITTAIIPAVEGQEQYSYIDETAGTGSRYWYQIQAVTADGNTIVGPAQDQYETGLAAVHGHAEDEQFHRDFLADDQMSFDGNRIEEARAEEVDRVKALNAGSILITHRPVISAAKSVLFTLKSSSVETPVNGDIPTGVLKSMAFFQQGANLRVDFGSTLKGTFNGAAGVGAWNSYAFVSSTYTQGQNNIITSKNGSEMTKWSNEGLSGFFSKLSELDTLSVGAAKNGEETVGAYQGEIAFITITDEIFSQAELNAYTEAAAIAARGTGIGIRDLMLDDSFTDNNWVFVGGEAVSGGYDQVEGVRNYIGQYEEYMRFRRAGAVKSGSRQRYVINSGKEGRTLSDIVTQYDLLVTRFEPRVVAYLVGKEDYAAGEAGIDTFKGNLKRFIDQTLALKEANNDIAFAVIQKPFAAKDDTTNTVIAKYSEAIDAVKAQYEEEQAGKIVIVDHYSQTNTTDFKTKKLIENGVLNKDGHYVIGKQLAAEVFGDTASYMGSWVDGTANIRVAEEQPDTYLTSVMPTVTAQSTSLQVVIPEGNGTEWVYELDMEGTIISGEVSSNTFEISHLVEGKAYVLKLRSADGTKQLCTVAGSLTEGATAVKHTQELDANQQRLAQMMEDNDRMTWIFMGDSITHGARLTYGYRSVPQLFESYLRDELDRKDDTVINTAIWGHDTNDTLTNIYQRVEKYVPDVVSIMLGTNDVGTMTADRYEQNMRAIVAKIKAVNENAVIIFRTPIYAWGSAHNRPVTLPLYIDRLEKIVAEDPEIILIDQWSWGAEYQTTYPWLKIEGNQFLFGDNLHPNPNGHLVMFRHFVKGVGLWTEDSRLTNLFYKMGITEEENNTVPALDTQTEGTISLSIDSLKTASGISDLGAVILKAVKQDGSQSFSTEVKDGVATIALERLPLDETYTVEVSGYRKEEAKRIVFASQEITLETVTETPVDISKLQALITEAEKKVETDYTEESWTTFMQALEQARQVLADTTNTDQTAVDTAKNSLQSAIDGLQEKETTEEQTVETPLFSVIPGTYTEGQSVTITSATEGATIYYTTDGTDPTADSTEYTQMISISESMTLKAIAIKEGMKNSAVAEAIYVIQIPTPVKETVKTPTFSVPAGTYTKAQKVTLTSATEGATIYYTTDGTAPTTSSPKYSQAISVDKTMTLKAVAVKEGMENSAVAEVAYVIQLSDSPDSVKQTVKAPTFSVSAGTYTKAQKVTLTSATEGAAIYYTTDGTAPTVDSTEYTQAISVDKTMILKAIAVKEGMENSAVATAAYTIKVEVKEKEWIFIDVPVSPSYWKYESVKYVYNRDIMGAITGTKEFQPDRPLSRSMFATVLYRMAGEPQVKYQAKFSDVPAGKWYSNAIIWAYENKIVSGMGDGTFGIDRNITREQIAKMLYEYARVCQYDVSAVKDLNSFTDVKSVSSWAVKYMQWATAVEMITGKPNDDAKTSFRMDPQGEATRAECAAMLMRFSKKYE